MYQIHASLRPLRAKQSHLFGLPLCLLARLTGRAHQNFPGLARADTVLSHDEGIQAVALLGGSVEGHILRADLTVPCAFQRMLPCCAGVAA